MTLSKSRNHAGVILSEDREATEPKDLQLLLGILQSLQTRCPIFATSKDEGKVNRYASTPDFAAHPETTLAHALKGHDFSRAVRDPKRAGALHPEKKLTHRHIKALVLALVSIFCGHLEAQSPTPTAHDLAQRVDHHYNQLHSLKSQFTEEYEGLGRVRTESGTLLLLKPGRMRWDYTSPAGKLFLLDGKFAWFYSKGNPQVQRIGAKQLDDFRSPLRFLLGHTQLEKEIDHLAVTPVANGSFTLAGIPHGQEKRIQLLALTVLPEGTITGIKIQETDGAETRFFFIGEQPNAPIPPATFKFAPPPGIPIVDALSTE